MAQVAATRYYGEPSVSRPMQRRDGEVTARPRRGRPARPPEEARSERVVTFVTRRELEGLEEIARAEEEFWQREPWEEADDF